jgi:hypothetical protein
MGFTKGFEKIAGKKEKEKEKPKVEVKKTSPIRLPSKYYTGIMVDTNDPQDG